MRSCLAALASCVPLILTGCGYPGEPLPPALNRPVPVVDLSAVERGSKIIVHFTLPDITTEGLPLRTSPDVDLRIGPAPPGRWQTPEWERISERVPADAVRIEGRSVDATVDASKFYGTPVVIGVRLRGPSGHDAGWARFESLTVVPALVRPEDVQVKNAPDAVLIDWHGAAPEFRIFRRLAGESNWNEAGRSNKPSYLDTGIESGKTYQYYVQGIEKAGEKYAESEPSATASIKSVDQFAPAVPAGLMVVPATTTIELVWERNTEKDFAAYRIYRDGQKLAGDLSAPSFSDKDVRPGTKYRYQVSAVDTSGNESAQSAPVEAAIP